MIFRGIVLAFLVFGNCLAGPISQWEADQPPPDEIAADYSGIYYPALPSLQDRLLLPLPVGALVDFSATPFHEHPHPPPTHNEAPEPGTLVLAGLALLAILTCRRR